MTIGAMTIGTLVLALIVTTLGSVPLGTAAENSPGPRHVMLTPDEMKWDPFPAFPGVNWSLLSGHPDKAGSPFVFRLKMPDAYKIPPHWHPVGEHVTVISGNFLFGSGDKFDEKVLKELPPGSYAFMPNATRHFAMSKGETVIQVSGVGPFKVIYVNPSDDPSKASRSH